MLFLMSTFWLASCVQGFDQKHCHSIQIDACTLVVVKLVVVILICRKRCNHLVLYFVALHCTRYRVVIVFVSSTLFVIYNQGNVKLPFIASVQLIVHLEFDMLWQS